LLTVENKITDRGEQNYSDQNLSHCQFVHNET
jgi:hypothetical protein